MIQLPLIFQTGMVLQRRKPICIWGTSDHDGVITVTLGGHSAIALIEGGAWKTYLPPMEATADLILTVSDGTDFITIEDVAIGEVWIAGGQSNMEFLLRYDAEKDTSCAIVENKIRCFEVPKISFPGQEAHYKMSDSGFWRKADSKSNGEFTAIGFYFGLQLYEKLQVPIGIINCTWGGTSASCWVSEAYLGGELSFYLEKAHEVQSAMDYDAELPKYIEIQKRILSSDINMGTCNLAPMEQLIDEATHQRLMTMNNWPFSAFRPCGLHELMVKTIQGYTLSGVIWYQGESDEYFSDTYEEAMKAVIRCWRDDWGESLPFIMVQLAGFEVMAEYLDFRKIRKAQHHLAATYPGVYLVTAMDVGMQYDIHPKQKKPVGTRLANQALDKIYHCHIPADSPTLADWQRCGDTIQLSLKHCGTGLEVRTAPKPAFDIYADGAAVQDFSVEVAENKITIQTLAVTSAKTVQVDFCQRTYCEVPLYSSYGLPVLPFSQEMS